MQSYKSKLWYPVTDIEPRLWQAVHGPKIVFDEKPPVNGGKKTSEHFVKKDRETSRVEREQHQRRVANQKWRAFRKRFPKRDRSRDIQRAREAKFLEKIDSVEFQGFSRKEMFLTLGLGAVAFGCAGVIMRAARRSFSRVEERTVGLLDTLTQSLETLAEAARKALGAAFWVPVLVTGLYCYNALNDNTLVKVALTTVLAAAIGHKIWGYVSSFFVDIEPQSGFDALPKMIATALCASYLPKEGAKLVPEIMRRVGSLPRATQGFEALFSWGMTVLEKIISVIAQLCGREAFYFGDAVTRQIKKWCSETEALEIELISGKRDNPPIEFIEKVFTKIQDGYHLKHAVGDDVLKAMLHRALDRLEARLRPYESQLMAAKTFRVEPEFLLLYGGSKQGKTTLLTKIASALLLATGLVESNQVLSNLWQKGDTKYFESYCGQKCLVMDDVFQEKVVPGMEGNEFMQIIRMVGNWSYPLNMASVDLKAKFFFNSPIIIGTTNVPGIQSTTAPQVISCPEAVARRVHRCLHIESAPDFTVDGGLDYVKLHAETVRRRRVLAEKIEKEGYKHTMTDVLDTFPWDAWVVTKWDWVNGRSMGVRVSLCDYIKDMARHVKSKLNAHGDAVEELTSFNQLLASAVNDLEAPSVQAEAGSAVESDKLPPKLVGAFNNLVDNMNAGSVAAGGSEIKFSKEGWDNAALLHAAAQLEGDEDFTDLFEQDPVLFYATCQAKVAAIQRENRSLSEIASDLMRSIMSFYAKHPVVGTLVTAVVGAATAWTGVKIFSIAKQFAKVLSSVFSIIGSALLGVANSVVSMLGSVFGFGKKPETEEVTSQSNLKETTPNLKPKINFAVDIAPQGFDASQFEVKHNHVYNNTYKIVAEGPSPVVIGQMMFVEGYLAVMPAHYREDIETKLPGDCILALIAAGQDSMVVRVTARQFLSQAHLVVDGSDLMFVHFDRTWFQAKRKITKFFLTSEQLALAVQDAHMVRLDVCQVNERDDKTYMASRHTMNAPRAAHVPELTIRKHKVKDLIEYQMQTAVGMCGAPLTLADPRYFGGRMILGIHVAGSVGAFARRAFAAPITTELLGQVIKHFSRLHHSVQDNFEEDLVERGVTLEDLEVEAHSGLREVGLVDGSFDLIGGVDKPISLAPNTKLKKSFIGELEPFGPMGQKPAHLRSTLVDGERKYPMVEGLRNYQSPMEIREIDGIRSIVDVASLPFREATQFESRRLFTFDEAVKGVEGLKIKAVNRTTSAGFPYVYTCTKGKTDFFGGEGDYDLTSDKCVELRRRVEYILNCAKDGVRLGHVCLDFLKDELRADEKVDTCQTRIISGSPIDYVLACRVMFGAFIAACFRHHTTTGLCPGINPYSDWWQLVGHLKSSGKSKFFDGDFKRFDASEQPYMHWEILDLINRWYDDGDDNARVRTVLWMDLVHSRHISGMAGDIRYIVQWNKSLPSGHPLTTVVNSWYSLISLTACFRHLTYGVVPFRDMWTHFSPATFGDDNISGISDAVSEVFNQVTVADKMFELFGLTYTSGVKGEALRPYKSLEECTFLKRGFSNDAGDKFFGGWLAPLAPGSFMYTSYYYKNARSMNKELAIKLDGTLGEMCLHPQEFWDEHAPKVMSVMREHLGVEPMFTSREGYLEETAAKTDFWF